VLQGARRHADAPRDRFEIDGGIGGVLFDDVAHQCESGLRAGVLALRHLEPAMCAEPAAGQFDQMPGRRI
jgi:hypothetical protein